MFVMQ